jgi:hypothetical protein
MGSTRHREIAVRFALGASRQRITRLVLTECLVLAAIGGALGALVGAAGVSLVRALASVEAPGVFRQVFGDSILPRGAELGIEPKILWIASGLAAVVSLLFGAVPAVRLSRRDHSRAFGSRAADTGNKEARIRAGLVVGQIVMATVLLVGAGLLTRSFVKLSGIDRGYDSSNVLAFQLVFPTAYPIERKAATIDTLLARLQASPTVQSVGFCRAGMLLPDKITVGVFVPAGRTLEEMKAYPEWPRLRSVSRGYLTATGVRVLDGRDLSEHDPVTGTPSIVISRSAARQFFGSTRAVGQVVDWNIDNSASIPSVSGCAVSSIPQPGGSNDPGTRRSTVGARSGPIVAQTSGLRVRGSAGELRAHPGGPLELIAYRTGSARSAWREQTEGARRCVT